MSPYVPIPRILIAGATSGVGKTTVTMAILAALARRGLGVQPFKAGPDYIDPSYHTAAAGGRPCRNLDSWLLPFPHLKELFARAARGADLALIEGVMGLFDGRGPLTDEGSTAELARLLEVPVVLVLDVEKTSRSAAAMALGYRMLDPRISLVGVIANRVAGAGHYSWVKQAVEALGGLPVLGYLPDRPDLALPERHLGLVPVAERGPLDRLLADLAGLAEENVDLDRLVELAQEAPAVEVGPGAIFPAPPPRRRATIAMAMDPAFSFYYQDNLDLLEAFGGALRPFSLISDSGLPDGVGAIYIGGGFPEVYARELAANEAMRTAIRRAAAEGMPIYAECGGLMYLCEALVDAQGLRYPMAGVLPCEAEMPAEGPVRLSYVHLETQFPSILFPAGERLRGHEFHWSRLRRVPPDIPRAYRVLEPRETEEGFVQGNVLASYVHLHFGAHPLLAERFVQAASTEW